MNKIILIAFTLFSTTAFGNDLFDDEVYQCIIKESAHQYPQYQIQTLSPRWGNIFILGEDSWTMVFVTSFDDGGQDRFFVEVNNGNTRSASLIFIGFDPMILNIDRCF